MLKHIYQDINSKENVKSEELTQAMIAEAIESKKVLNALQALYSDGDKSDGKSDRNNPKWVKCKCCMLMLIFLFCSLFLVHSQSLMCYKYDFIVLLSQLSVY